MSAITSPEDLKKLIVGFNADHEGGSTYDLRIGVIVAPKNSSAVSKFLRGESREVHSAENCRVEIPPKAMAWIVSKEELCLDSTVTGHVDLVNTLSKLGILALNTGVVDPTYSGPIATAIINFSNKTRDLRIGDRFFRVSSVQHDAVSKKVEPIKREKYIRDLVMQSRDFNSTFLDIEGLQSETETIVNERINTSIPRFFPIFAFFIASCSLLAALISFIIASPWFKEFVSVAERMSK